MDLLQENALGVKVPSGETILTKYLGGYTETVVITGNEYASLTNDEPTKAGKVEVNGKTTLNWEGTTIDDIGSSFVIWAVKGGAQNNDTVLLAEKSAVNAYEEYTYAADLFKGPDAIKMSVDKNTEDYINFDDQAVEYYLADIRVEYTLTINSLTNDDISALKKAGITVADSETATTKFTRTGVIKPGAKVEDQAYAILEYIFANYNDADGEVYVGTQTEKDISNVVSFRTFKSEYLTASGKTAEVTANENGNYVKVIDNDGDGVAEYILKTTYTMAVIDEINSRNEYTLSEIADNKNVTVKASAISTEDELAEGDIVVYAAIDGVYYMNLAEMVTETIDKKGINTKTETITCGDNTYGQSEIDVFAPAGYYTSLLNAQTEVSYDLYLDNYGYVRAFVESSYRNGMVLLTDAYYNTDKRTDDFKATIYDREAEKQVDVTVVDSRKTPADVFINISETGDDGNRGTWKRLKKAQEIYDDVTSTFVTNIAAATTSDAGYTLTKVTDLGNTTLKYNVEELKITNGTTKLSDRTLTSTVSSKKVQTTTSTVYYLVTKSNAGNTIVSWTGYNGAPSSAALGKTTVAYAVTVPGTTYDVAQIVVFETTAAETTNLYFVYDLISKVNVAIGYDSDAAAYDSNVEVKLDQTDLLEFYKAVGSTVTKIDGTTERYDANNIYAGKAYTLSNVTRRDYWAVDAASYNNTTKNLTFRESEVVVYKVTETANHKYVVSDNAGINTGDKLILVTDGKDNVQYILNVSESKTLLDILYADIEADNQKALATGNVTFYGVSDGDAKDDASATAKTIQVSYKTALDNAAAGIVIKNAKSYTVTDATGTEVTTLTNLAPDATNGATYTVTLLNNNGEFETWTLKQAAQVKTLCELTSNDATGNIEVDASNVTAAGTATVNVKSDLDATTIESLVKALKADGSDNCSVAFESAKDAQGNDVAQGEGIAHAKTIKVKVTNADDYSKIVTLTITNVNGYLITLGSGVTAKYANNTAITSGTRVAANSSVTFTGSTGKKMSGLPNGTTQTDDNSNNTSSAVTVTTNLEITEREKETYTLKVNGDANTNTVADQTFAEDANSPATTITPKAGNVLKSVSVNDVAQNITDSTTFTYAAQTTPNKNITITVTTEAKTYTVSFSADSATQTLSVTSNDTTDTTAYTATLTNADTNVQIGQTKSGAVGTPQTGASLWTLNSGERVTVTITETADATNVLGTATVEVG
jgi:hypothetical protein